MIVEFIGAAIVCIIQDITDDSFSIRLEFLDALYYMIITSASVGYGDVYPQTFLARSAILIVLCCVLLIFADNISKLSVLMRQANFQDKYYKMQDHLVIIGTTKVEEIVSLLITLIGIKGIADLPRILIVGEQRLEDTDLDQLLKNPLAQEADKIKYLSIVDGIDMIAYRKACIQDCKAVYFVTNFKVSEANDSMTQNLVHRVK